MPVAALRNDTADTLVARCLEVAAVAEGLLADATLRVRERVSVDGKAQSKLLDREQRAAHGLAWLATYVEALRQLAAYAERMQAEGLFGEIEDLIVRIGSAEYFAQILGGIPMSQNEIVRLSDLGLSASAIAARMTPSVEAFVADGNTAARRARLVELIREQHDPLIGNSGLDDTLESIREEMRKFAASEVIPNAQGWHRTNSYIPLDIISHMAELGVFGLTIPEDYGGMALGKESMCVVSEELSRGYIGVGSLGTRSEIAAELILAGGTEEQKRKWLPKIASGEILPTAVFTEPNTGSDLASLKTRAVRDGDVYKVYGNKTWITHPVRADLMTLLVRTNPKEPGYRGLSMLLAEKPRGTDDNPFPAKGMSGTEIEVLGYRGMKEYEIAFDGFEVKAENLLGGVEGLGFKQLMQTFEVRAHPDRGARHRRRAVGDGRGARLCQQRQQFGEPIINFPRVADKIAMMAVEIMIARQLTYFAARAEGFRPALRSRSRHGEVARGARRLEFGRQCRADPWRQRLRARIPDLAHSVRCAHPQHFRGCGRNPGAGDRPPAARRKQLNALLARWSRARRVHMQKIKIDQGDWVVVCDGKKALILENVGDWKFPNLQTREVFEQNNPPTHEQGSDAPGRSYSVGRHAAQRDGADRLAYKGGKGFPAGSRRTLDAAIGAGDTQLAGDGGAAARARRSSGRPIRRMCAAGVARGGRQGFREDAGARDREASDRRAKMSDAQCDYARRRGRWRSAAAEC